MIWHVLKKLCINASWLDTLKRVRMNWIEIMNVIDAVSLHCEAADIRYEILWRCHSVSNQLSFGNTY